MKPRLYLMLVIVLLVAMACEGGGSVRGHRESCRASGDTGRCEGSFNKLSGTYAQRMEANLYRPGDAVFIEANVSVESGAIRISVEAPDGTVTSMEVGPGASSSLSGLSTAESGMDVDAEIPISYEALDGEATGVSYTVDFRRP